jgi:hypothetical protein
MSFCVNNNELDTIYYNNQEVKSVYYNNNLVWQPPYPWVGWENATWEDIYNLCKGVQSGAYRGGWPSDVVLGAKKEVKSSYIMGAGSDGTAMMRLVGIDIDGPGVLTFCPAYILSASLGTDYDATWNNTTTSGTVGYILNQYYLGLQDGVKDYIKPLTKMTLDMSDKTKLIPIEFKVWLVSSEEIGLGPVDNLPGQFTQGVNTPDPYFTDNASRQMRLDDIDGGFYPWKTRSYCAAQQRFYTIRYDGSGVYATKTAMLAPAFAIG